jgi:hypothetical protein
VPGVKSREELSANAIKHDWKLENVRSNKSKAPKQNFPVGTHNNHCYAHAVIASMQAFLVACVSGNRSFLCRHCMNEAVIRLFGPGNNYANQGALINQDSLICPAKINLLEIVLEQSL